MNNTLNSIIDSMLIEINEDVITDLSKLGYSREEATKVVSEFSDFDIIEDAAQNPVVNF